MAVIRANLIGFIIAFFFVSVASVITTPVAYALECETVKFGVQNTNPRLKGYRRAPQFEKILGKCLDKAEEGNIPAAAILGYMYRHGYGTSRDINSARVWYQKAAKEGSELAETGLSYLSQDGFVVNPNQYAADDETSSSQGESQKDDPASNLSNDSNQQVEKLSSISCDYTAPCTLDDSGLDLRVIPLSETSLYDSVSGATKPDHIQPFVPWYVYGVQGDNSNSSAPAWYLVGLGYEGATGWFRAKDVIEWRNALLASYTLPKGRSQILMFDTEGDLLQLANVSENERSAVYNEYLEQIQSGSTPKGVVAVEPELFVDIDQQFYLLPIVQYSKLKEHSNRALALKLVSAVPGDREENIGLDKIRSVKRAPVPVHPLCRPDEGHEYVEHVTANSTSDQQKVDIVFVVDLTGSMGPYLESVKKGISNSVKRLQAIDIKESIRYGLVGYQDNHNKLDDLEYTTKNFTNRPISPKKLIQKLETQVDRIRETDDDWAEEMYAGVFKGLNDFNWRNDAWRMMVLIGDASSHEPGHPQSTIKMSAEELRAKADELNVTILPVFLKNPKAGTDQFLAEPQFKKLGINKSDEGAGFIAIDTSSPDVAKDISNFTYNYWEVLLAQINSETIEPLNSEENDDEVSQNINDEICNVVQAAALVNYVGAEPVNEVTFWASDFDLGTDNRIKSLDTRVMMTRVQLDNLTTRLQNVRRAMDRVSQTNSDSAENLQKILISATAGDDNLNKVSEASKLLPKWLAAMPYRSQLQEISIREFVRKSAQFHRETRDKIDNKIAYYKDKMNSSNWFKLDPESNDSYRNEVTAIPLSQLP